MFDFLGKHVLPAAAVDDVESAVPLAEAILAGGLNVIEITLRTEAAVRCIRSIAKALPEMIVGAGTVLSVTQLERAVDGGARFGVAPGSNESVVLRAAEMSIPFIPGVMTPSEMDRALGWGCKVLKLFPAESVGGPKAVEALAGPFGHTGVQFVPTGGINAGNMRSYLALPIVTAVGGSWMVARKLVQDRNWQEIARLTAEAVKLGQ